MPATVANAEHDHCRDKPLQRQRLKGIRQMRLQQETRLMCVPASEVHSIARANMVTGAPQGGASSRSVELWSAAARLIGHLRA